MPQRRHWGFEVKSGQTLWVVIDDEAALRLTLASLGETDNNLSESVHLYITIGGRRLVLGTLHSEWRRQQLFDLEINQTFSMSHDWNNGSLYFNGEILKGVCEMFVRTDDDGSSEEDSEEEEEEAIQERQPDSNSNSGAGKDNNSSDDSEDNSNEEEEKQPVKVCARCNWSFPSRQPNKRQRSKHQSVCGYLPGFPVVTSTDENDDYCNKLPLDVFLDVLKKLPVKSVLRFKAACKPWNTHISSSSFITEFQTKLRDRVLLCYDHFKNRCVSIEDDPSLYTYELKMTLPTSIGEPKVSTLLGSVNGLFCFGEYSKRDDLTIGGSLKGLVVWNPTIQKSIYISGPAYRVYFLGFGVCPRTNNLKVVTFSDRQSFYLDNLQVRSKVYSLRSGVWRRPFGIGKAALAHKKISLHIKQCVVTSENLYWLGDEENESGVGVVHLIISFGLTGEQFCEVRLPTHLAKTRFEDLSICKLRDSLIVKNWDENNQNHGIWLMDESKTFSELYTIKCPAAAQHVSRMELLTFGALGKPVIQMDNGRGGDGVYFYDPESKEFIDARLNGDVSAVYGGDAWDCCFGPLPDDAIFASLYSGTLFLSSENTYSQHRLMMIETETGGVTVSFMDEYAIPQQKESLTLPNNLQTRPIIVASPRGVFCFKCLLEGVPRVVLWNPLLGISVPVDLPDYLDKVNTFVGFGVCPRTMEPKVVMITFKVPREHHQLQVYGLSSRTWRSERLRHSLPYNSIKFGEEVGNIVTSQFIYWLVHDKCPSVARSSDVTRYRMMSFNLESETLDEIILPDSLADNTSLRIFNRRDALVFVGKDEKAWIMQGKLRSDIVLCGGEYEMQQRGLTFTELFTVNTPKKSRVLGFRTSGEALIVTDDDKVCVYEPKSQKMSEIPGYKGKEMAFVGSYINTNLLI